MVLENSTAEDGFNENPPASDVDPYASTDSLTTGDSLGNIRIDAAQLPKPMPIFGPLLGFNNKLTAKLIHVRIEAASKTLRRPVTEEEATAMAYWTAKQLSITSYGGPLGMGVSFWRAFSTADKFRFPFYQPDLSTFPKDSWPSAKRAILSGVRATTIWHLTRAASYAIVGNFVGNILFTSYATSVAAVGELTDKRLKPYVDALRNEAQTMRGKLPNQPRQPGMVDGVQQKDATSLWKEHRSSIGDDASPTAGTYDDANSSDSGGLMDDQEMKAQERRQQPDARTSPAANTASTFDMQKTAPQPQSFDNTYDDASPTGGRGMVDDNAAGQSSWARIRQQASTGSSRATGQQQVPRNDQNAWNRGRANARQEQKDGSTVGDDFTFSTSEEERQLARTDAQREFDARVEKERRGGDFSGSGDQRRW